MSTEDILFFYPALPRVFKNIEVVCDAAKYLSDLGNKNFKVKLTIDGNENNYSRQIVSKYSDVDSIDFIGIQPYDEIQKIYKKVSCLIFPSRLETWGLPITEFKELGKPMLCVDLPYAHETIGDYNLVSFFKEDNYIELANLMLGLIKSDISFGGNERNNIQSPFAENWEDLFNLILCN
jgi:glycosyltransferase involved in cell wall biosynthesis